MSNSSEHNEANLRDSSGFTPTIVVVILGLVIVAGGVLFVLHNSHSNNLSTTSEAPVQVSQIPTSTQTPTPTASPLTQSNIDQPLTSASINVDQTLKQANTDLSDLNNVDTSQDNPNSI